VVQGQIGPVLNWPGSFNSVGGGAGRPLEDRGDLIPRGMITALSRAQNSAYISTCRIGRAWRAPFNTMPSQGAHIYSGGLTDIDGILVGHWTDSHRPTGCTVVLIPGGGVAGVDIRGSAPGTRETDLLNPVSTVETIQGIALSGGSAFGLDTAGGVMRYLEENSWGFPTRSGVVPIVPAAILYDLDLGEGKRRPDQEAGYQACLAASREPVAEGSVGAGAGATIGKILGPGSAMKGGLGSFSVTVGSLTVAALVVVNALGDVIDPDTGVLLAGARGPDGLSLADSSQILKDPDASWNVHPLENTTLAVVATNAVFGKAAMTKIAQMGHDGLARAIRPVHLPFDGDAVFAVSTGQVAGVDLGQAGSLAAEAVARAVVRAVLTAKGVPGYPAQGDLL
jgi:L-aminopeptidase/D-esterase-like protein